MFPLLIEDDANYFRHVTMSLELGKRVSHRYCASWVLPSPLKVIILLSHFICHPAFNAATDQAGSIALSIAEVFSFFLSFFFSSHHVGF
jgi:hypothetical protein